MRSLLQTAEARLLEAVANDTGTAGASWWRHRAEQDRHNVPTFLVARGEILQAQARLGHADAATTLREYAYALPGTDGEIADALDRYLDQPDGADEIALRPETS